RPEVEGVILDEVPLLRRERVGRHESRRRSGQHQRAQREEGGEPPHELTATGTRRTADATVPETSRYCVVSLGCTTTVKLPSGAGGWRAGPGCQSEPATRCSSCGCARRLAIPPSVTVVPDATVPEG